MAATASSLNMFRQACFALPTKRAFATSSSIASKQPVLFKSLSTASPILRRSNVFAQQPKKVMGALPVQSRIAAFHASARKSIMPPGPQVIPGTVNDPAPTAQPEPIHGSYHWSFERLIAVSLVPLTVAPFAAGTFSPTLDSVLVATLLIHSYIGFQSCIIDYFPARKWPGLRKFFDWALRISTLLVAVAFYEFETHDVGVTEGIKKIWTA